MLESFEIHENSKERWEPPDYETEIMLHYQAAG